MRRLTLTLAILTLGVPLFAQENPPTPRPIRVAVYTGGGASPSWKTVLAALEKYPGVQAAPITADDVRAGKLKNFQLILLPGGSGSAQAKALGEEGREQVRQFVRGGGGYVGICAGSYLASRSYPWSLHLLDANVVDRAHWNRGFGDVELRLSEKGKGFFGANSDQVTIYYHQGPLLAPGNDPVIPDFDSLAAFETEVAKNGAPKGVMKGTTAVAAGRFGAGRVFCFSPHPEKREPTHELLHKAVRWAVEK
jgi:hypothetical protein